MLIPLHEIVAKYNLHPKGVLHIGAWDGQEVDDYLLAGIQMGLLIEANLAISDTLDAKLNPHFPSYLVLYLLVSDKDGVETFHITNNGQSSSILELGVHKELYPEIFVKESYQKQAYTIKTIYEMLGFKPSDYDFVNIDIQGAELKAIKGMGDEIISHVKAFYLEVNKKETYKGCPLVEEIDRYLEERGFYRAETAEWRHDTWTDALYLRK